MVSELSLYQYVALDLETTGLVAETDRIVELGAVRFTHDGTELDRFDRLVHPGRPMSPAAQAIHGISDADLAGADHAERVLPQFLHFLGNPRTTLLLAHNAAFDAGFLGCELARLGRDAAGYSVVDTLALARRQIPEARDHRLETLARLYRLDLEGPHRALADSLRVKGLWLALGGPLLGVGDLVSYPILDRKGDTAVPEGWDLIREAIAHGWTVRMEYSGGSRGPLPREITPRGFAHRGGIPYLVALCHIDAYEKSFRLDRLTRFQIVETTDLKSSSTSALPES